MRQLDECRILGAPMTLRVRKRSGFSKVTRIKVREDFRVKCG
jgi:hypothetical protein